MEETSNHSMVYNLLSDETRLSPSPSKNNKETLGFCFLKNLSLWIWGRFKVVPDDGECLLAMLI